MVLINDKKLSLIAKLLIAYILLLDFAFLIFAFTASPSTDIASVTASLLGWTATLFTPIAAYFFYDSWKDQKNYDLKKELLIQVSNLVSTQYIKIAEPAKKIKRLEEINTTQITISSIDGINNCYQLSLLNEIYVLLKTYEEFSQDASLMEYKDAFCDKAFQLERFLIEIEKKYRNYCEVLGLDNNVNCTKRECYKGDSKTQVQQDINEILYYFRSGLEFQQYNEDKWVLSYKITFEKAVNEFDDKYNDFIKALTSKLRA